jgi:AAA ATPase domain
MVGSPSTPGMSVESGCWFSKGGPLGGGGSPGQGSTERLIGRNQDLEFLHSFVDQSAAGGGALLLSGDAGVGKTVLLDAAATHAAAAGTQVVRAAGAEFEANLSFAALNQVLYPLLGGLEQLSALHGKALRVALGLSDGSPADQLVVSNAALALLQVIWQTHPTARLRGAPTFGGEEPYWVGSTILTGCAGGRPHATCRWASVRPAAAVPVPGFAVPGKRGGHGHRRPSAAAVFPAGGSAGAPAGRGGEPASGVVSSYLTS